MLAGNTQTDRVAEGVIVYPEQCSRDAFAVAVPALQQRVVELFSEPADVVNAGFDFMTLGILPHEPVAAADIATVAVDEEAAVVVRQRMPDLRLESRQLVGWSRRQLILNLFNKLVDRHALSSLCQ